MLVKTIVSLGLFAQCTEGIKITQQDHVKSFEAAVYREHPSEVVAKFAPELDKIFPATSHVAGRRKKPGYNKHSRHVKEDASVDGGGEGQKASEHQAVAFGWGIFVAFVCVGCVVEIVLLGNWEKSMTIGEACLASSWWIAVAAGFCGMIFSLQKSGFFGKMDGYSWIDGYLLEFMLSFDNLYFFVLIMDCFKVPSRAKNRILLMSVVYSFGCRVLMYEILYALKNYTGIVQQILGVFIAYLAYKVITDDDEDEDLSNNSFMVFLKNIFPVTTEMDEHGSFFIDGKATGSCLAVLSLAMFDTIFAVDSVTAKAALIDSTYINLTSSGLAMIMLRAAYFVLDCLMDMFKHLKYGIGVILFVIAFITIFPDLLPISNFQYMCLLIGIMVITMAVSAVIQFQEKEKEKHDRLVEKGSEDSSKSRLSWCAPKK